MSPAPRPRAAHPAWTAVTLAYIAAVLLMLAPLRNFSAFSSAIHPGDPKLLAWTFAWTSHAILTGTSLFDANVFYPARPALAFIEHHVGVGIWGLPLFAVTHNAVLVYSVLQVLALVANGVAMHAFARRWLHSHSAALVGGLVFAVSSSRLLYSGHVPVVWNCWLPLLLIALDRWTARGEWKWALGSAMLFSLQALATWYLAVMAFIVSALFVPWRWVWSQVWQPAGEHAEGEGVKDGRRRLNTLLQASGGVLLVALVLWPFARPYLQLQGQEQVTPELAGRYAATWGSYVQPPEGALIGSLVTRVTGLASRSVAGEQAQYMGLLTLCLVVVGAGRCVFLAFKRRRGDANRDVLWGGCFLMLGAMAIALSFGPSAHGARGTPFDWLMLVPGLNLFRVPARFAVLVTLAVSGLAAFGFDGIRRAARRFSLASLLLIPAMLVEWAVVPGQDARPQPDVTPPIYDVVARLDVHALVSLPCYRRTADWPLDADYMLYSTRHWHPIVNGYGRAEPHALVRVLGAVNAFPGRNAAARMRELGIDYVVVHSARFADHAAVLLEYALASDDFQLVAKANGDYLFHLLPSH